MADILITRGKHRCYIYPQSEVGVKWVHDTFAEKDIGTASVVSFNAEVLEDWVNAMAHEDLEVEVK